MTGVEVARRPRAITELKIFIRLSRVLEGTGESLFQKVPNCSQGADRLEHSEQARQLTRCFGVRQRSLRAFGRLSEAARVFEKFVRCGALPAYLLTRSGSTITHTTFSPIATIDFEKSQTRATAPGLFAGITTVSPRAHLCISSDALASPCRKPADAGRQ